MRVECRRSGKASRFFMEDAMPARTTRKEARDRLLKTMLEALDRIIPEDESKPLKGTDVRRVGRTRPTRSSRR